MTARLKQQLGFTFIELVVTLIVLAIAAAFAFPAYRGLSEDSAIRSSAMSLIATLNEARALSLSLRRDVTVNITANAGSWEMSYVQGGNTIERNWTLASSKDTLQVKDNGGTNVTAIVFQSNGFINLGGTPITFTICDDRVSEKGRAVSLEKTGKVKNETVICS